MVNGYMHAELALASCKLCTVLPVSEDVISVTVLHMVVFMK